MSQIVPLSILPQVSFPTYTDPAPFVAPDLGSVANMYERAEDRAFREKQFLQQQEMMKFNQTMKMFETTSSMIGGGGRGTTKGGNNLVPISKFHQQAFDNVNSQVEAANLELANQTSKGELSTVPFVEYQNKLSKIYSDPNYKQAVKELTVYEDFMGNVSKHVDKYDPNLINTLVDDFSSSDKPFDITRFQNLPGYTKVDLDGIVKDIFESYQWNAGMIQQQFPGMLNTAKGTMSINSDKLEELFKDHVLTNPEIQRALTNRGIDITKPEMLDAYVKSEVAKRKLYGAIDMGNGTVLRVEEVGNLTKYEGGSGYAAPGSQVQIEGAEGTVKSSYTTNYGVTNDAYSDITNPTQVPEQIKKAKATVNEISQTQVQSLQQQYPEMGIELGVDSKGVPLIQIKALEELSPQEAMKSHGELINAVEKQNIALEQEYLKIQEGEDLIQRIDEIYGVDLTNDGTLPYLSREIQKVESNKKKDIRDNFALPGSGNYSPGRTEEELSALVETSYQEWLKSPDYIKETDKVYAKFNPKYKKIQQDINALKEKNAIIRPGYAIKPIPIDAKGKAFTEGLEETLRGALIANLGSVVYTGNNQSLKAEDVEMINNRLNNLNPDGSKNLKYDQITGFRFDEGDGRWKVDIFIPGLQAKEGDTQLSTVELDISDMMLTNPDGTTVPMMEGLGLDKYENFARVNTWVNEVQGNKGYYTDRTLKGANVTVSQNLISPEENRYTFNLKFRLPDENINISNIPNSRVAVSIFNELKEIENFSSTADISDEQLAQALLQSVESLAPNSLTYDQALDLVSHHRGLNNTSEVFSGVRTPTEVTKRLPNEPIPVSPLVRRMQGLPDMPELTNETSNVETPVEYFDADGNVNADTSKVLDALGYLESRGSATPYQAVNPTTSDFGKYQIKWKDHKAEITAKIDSLINYDIPLKTVRDALTTLTKDSPVLQKAVLSGTEKEQRAAYAFASNPEFQNKFAGDYIQNIVKNNLPELRKLNKQNGDKYSDAELIYLSYNQGNGGAKSILRGDKNLDKKVRKNMLEFAAQTHGSGLNTGFQGKSPFVNLVDIIPREAIGNVGGSAPYISKDVAPKVADLFEDFPGIVVSNAARTFGFNKTVPGAAKDSAHTEGKALDISANQTKNKKSHENLIKILKDKVTYAAEWAKYGIKDYILYSDNRVHITFL